MKKVFLLIAVICYGGFIQAKPVDVKTAQVFATKYLAEKFLEQNKPSNFKLELANADDVNSKTAPELYIFNVPNNQGFIMIAADDIVTPVLAYSTESAFNVYDKRNPANFYLHKYQRQINTARNNNLSASAKTLEEWSNVANNRRAKSGHSVAQLLTTTWDQCSGYNGMCPQDPAASATCGVGIVPTGCVATATAQIMKYWNYPSHGYLNHSYAAYGYNVLSFDFQNFNFRWSDMFNSSISQQAAVDTLMYACGVAVDMGYGASGSGACVVSSDCSGGGAEAALKNYFLYDGNLHGLKIYSNDSLWVVMLENELNHHRPIDYAGAEANGEGHNFIFDGYNTTDMFHVNWGWSGNSNGFFLVTNLAPPALGVGAGGGNFDADEEAVVGIAPPPALALSNAISPATQTIAYNQKFTISTNIVNNGPYDFQGFLAAIVTDLNGNFAGIFKPNLHGSMLDTIRLGNTLSFNQDTVFTTGKFGLSGLYPGTYNVSIYSKTPGAPTWTMLNNGTSNNNVAQIIVSGATGINGVVLDGTISMMPNPANDMVRIENNNPMVEFKKIEILNMQGQVVAETIPTNSKATSIALNDIANGFYLVKISTNAGELNKKLVVQK